MAVLFVPFVIPLLEGGKPNALPVSQSLPLLMPVSGCTALTSLSSKERESKGNALPKTLTGRGFPADRSFRFHHKARAKRCF